MARLLHAHFTAIPIPGTTVSGAIFTKWSKIPALANIAHELDDPATITSTPEEASVGKYTL